LDNHSCSVLDGRLSAKDDGALTRYLGTVE
jgi:hypothetical protein